MVKLCEHQKIAAKSITYNITKKLQQQLIQVFAFFAFISSKINIILLRDFRYTDDHLNLAISFLKLKLELFHEIEDF